MTGVQQLWQWMVFNRFEMHEDVCMCRASKAPFTFIVNIMVPGTPPFHLVMSWAADARSFDGVEALSR